MTTNTSDAAYISKEPLRGGHSAILISTVLGLAFTILAFMTAKQWELLQIQNDLNKTGTAHSYALQRLLDQHLLVVQSVEGLFNSSNEVTEAEFIQFTEPFFKRLPDLHGLGWLPRITGSERLNYETEQSKRGLIDFKIRDMDSSGKREVAPERPEHFPVTFLARPAINKRVFGWDFMGETELAKSLNFSRNTGKTSVTSKIDKSIGGNSGKYRFLLIQPIYQGNKKKTPPIKRPDHILGFAVASNRITSILQRSLSGVNEKNIDIHLFDASDPGTSRKLYFYPSDSSESKIPTDTDEKAVQKTLHHVSLINLADRKWRIYTTPTPNFISARHSPLPWIVMAVGLAFSGLITLYIHQIQRATIQARLFAREQTLSKQNLQESLNRQKEVESSLREYSSQLEQLNDTLTLRNQELDEFTYVASHDLQEPLRKISAFSSLLKIDLADDLSEDAKENLTYLTDAAKRMQVLVNDLLDLSRSSRREMNSYMISLDECVDGAIQSLDILILETGADVKRTTLPEVWGDKTLLTQLFQNLIHNAIKFASHHKPVVKISATRNTNSWLLDVEDNGIGIEPQYTQQIFAPFKRLHGRNKFDGTGIGLAVCRKAVERHGGKIWVESKLDCGSHFLFTLADKKEESLND